MTNIPQSYLYMVSQTDDLLEMRIKCQSSKAWEGRLGRDLKSMVGTYNLYLYRSPKEFFKMFLPHGIIWYVLVIRQGLFFLIKILEFYISKLDMWPYRLSKWEPWRRGSRIPWKNTANKFLGPALSFGIRNSRCGTKSLLTNSLEYNPKGD